MDASIDVPGFVLPKDAVQCPITSPFSRYGFGTTIIDACCKCGDQSKCTLVGDIKDRSGINYFNFAGVNAMQTKDGTVDIGKSNYDGDHKIKTWLVKVIVSCVVKLW